jgi:hypothetical protein
MTELFLDTEPPEKLPTMASVIHLPIPPYHSIRLKPSSSRSLSPIKPFISAQPSKKPNSAISRDPLEEFVEIPIHPTFHTYYTEMTAEKTGSIYYDQIAKLVSRSITLKQEIHSKWKSITLREHDWFIVGWALVYRRCHFHLAHSNLPMVSFDIVYRHLGLCIQDICGVTPSPTESFKPWHIGRLVDVLMYLRFRKQGASGIPKNLHGHYPSFRTLMLSAKHSSSKNSASQAAEDESLRRWVLLRALWDLLGRLFVWEDANVKSIEGGSSTAQINDPIDSSLVIDWKRTAFPLAITSWVKHALSYSVRAFLLLSIY